MANMVRAGVKKKVVAKIFRVSRQTVWKWCKRAKHRGRESFRDQPRRPKKGKITRKVELSVVELRTKLGWGTARIQQALFNLPSFMRQKLSVCVQRVRLCRVSINEVLREYGLNGYEREEKAWKFFKTQLVSKGVPDSYADYMMGHLPDKYGYNDVESLGVEKLRNIYATANLRIREAHKAGDNEL